MPVLRSHNPIRYDTRDSRDRHKTPLCRNKTSPARTSRAQFSASLQLLQCSCPPQPGPANAGRGGKKKKEGRQAKRQQQHSWLTSPWTINELKRLLPSLSTHNIPAPMERHVCISARVSARVQQPPLSSGLLAAARTARNQPCRPAANRISNRLRRTLRKIDTALASSSTPLASTHISPDSCHPHSRTNKARNANCPADRSRISPMSACHQPNKTAASALFRSPAVDKFHPPHEHDNTSGRTET